MVNPPGPNPQGGAAAPAAAAASAASAAASSTRRTAPEEAAQPEAKRQAIGPAAHTVAVPTTPPNAAARNRMRALIMDQRVWENTSEDPAMLAESAENEAKRMRFTAAVSLGEAIDYAPLEGLTVDMLSKVSGLSDDEELAGKK